MEKTSGELIYRLHNLHKSDLSSDVNVSAQLRKFLDIEQIEHQRYAQNVERIKNLKKLLAKTYESRLTHVQSNLLHSVADMKQALLLQIGMETMECQNTIQNNASECNAHIYKAMLTYVNVLKKELRNAYVELAHEQAQKESLRLQRLVHRDILLFNMKLKLETNNKIELIALSPDSAQFQRCVKAVEDNLGRHYPLNLHLKTAQSSKKPPVTVLNVYKLQNQYLSATLQVSISSPSSSPPLLLF